MSGAVRQAKGPARSIAVQYEIMLQETLAAAGEPGAGTGTASISAKRLACFVGLMRELLSAGAFGALQGLMSRIMAELHNALYVGSTVTATDISEPLPAGWTPTKDTRVPFFAALAHAEAQGRGMAAEVERLRAKLGGGEDVQEQKLKLAMRRIGDLQDELASRDKDLAARASEIQELHAERRALTEQARADHRHLIQELEKHKEKIGRMEIELQQYKGVSMQEEIARRAFNAVAVRVGEEAAARDKALGLGAGEASKLAEQLLLLRNVRVDKYERQVAEMGVRAVCGEAFKMEGDAKIDRLREEFLQEIELAQGELTTLREHISEVQLEAQILRSAAGLMVRPDELEAFARRTRAQQRKEEMRKVSAGKRDGVTIGPAGGDPMWAGYITKCEDPEEVHPRVPRLVRPELAKEHLLGTMRSKYVKDMDPKLTRVNVGEGLEGFEAITHWSERRETLADHLLACLMQLYGNRQVSLLVMHGVMMGVERARADDTVMELSAKALGNQVEEPMWWSLVEIKRLMEGRMESHTDFEHILQLLYPDIKQMERHGILDEFDDTYGSDQMADSVLQYFASKLLVRSEPRYVRWLDVFVAEDSSGRRAMGRQDLLKITTKQMPGVPREVVQQVYSLLAVAWGSQEIPVETLAMACTALELSTLKRGGGH